MHSLNEIKLRIANHVPQKYAPNTTTRQAAVAIVVHEDSGHCQVMFIKRAEVEGDPWSGHMAFPGGHRDPGDTTLRSAAVRETHEETGLDLSEAEFLGCLSHQRAAPRGRTLNMLVAPFVFGIRQLPVLNPNDEVDDIVWGSLDNMISGGNHDTERFMMGGIPTPFSGYRLKPDRFVWGLTYRTLQSFFSVLDSTYVVPPEPN